MATMGNYSVHKDQLKTFEDIIRYLDGFGVGFLAVLDSQNKLYGIVTDGDVRKALLNQKKDINDIINTEPFTLPISTPKAQIITYLQTKRRIHVPLTDEEGTLIDVFLLNNFEPHYKPNHVVIMVGGLGSRLGKLTEEMPKPMLEVKGKPILEYIIDSFKNQGFNKFILCVNYKKEVIKNYFEDGSGFGVSIQYIVETSRLGTAGAISLINDECLEHPLFVVNGDVITNIDYQSVLDFYHGSKAAAVMCTKSISQTNPYAEVSFDAQYNLVDLKEKPTSQFYINLGVYILNKAVIGLLAKNEFFDMPNLFLKAKETHCTIKVFNVNDDWMDIGKPNDYLTIRND